MNTPQASLKKAIEKLNYFEKLRLKNLITQSTSSGMSRFYLAIDNDHIEKSKTLKFAD